MRRVVLLAAIGALVFAAPAFAQNADWDTGWQGISTLAYGPGAKIAVTMIAGYLFFHGLAHERTWQTVLGVAGALGYWGMGVILGKAHIV